MKRAESVWACDFIAADDGQRTVELSFASWRDGNPQTTDVYLSPELVIELYCHLTPIVRDIEARERDERDAR
jgi:hypothetical protein